MEIKRNFESYEFKRFKIKLTEEKDRSPSSRFKILKITFGNEIKVKKRISKSFKIASGEGKKVKKLISKSFKIAFGEDNTFERSPGSR